MFSAVGKSDVAVTMQAAITSSFASARKSAMNVKTCALLLALGLPVVSQPARAALINVQFDGASAQTGAALIGSAGDVWNQFNTASSGSGALATSANTTSGLSLTYSASMAYNANPSYTQFTNTPYANLMQGILIAPLSLQVSGLAPKEGFDLYLYTQGDDNANTRSISLTVNGVTQTDTQTNANTFIANNNYALFVGTANAAGNISVSGATANIEGDLNGFQLQTLPVPEPASLLLLTTGLIALAASVRSQRSVSRAATTIRRTNRKLPARSDGSRFPDARY